MSVTSPSTSQIDLSTLATDRPRAMHSKLVYRKPHWLKWFLVASLTLGLMAILGIAMEAFLFPPHSVTVVPVIATRSEAQAEGTVVFQAAGWIEPRPSLVNVAAMVEGVVDEVLVVEGQSVQMNDTIAKLVDTDAKLAVRQANATLRLRKSELESREAECKAAKLRFENPVHLQAPLAEAQSLLAKSETELAKLPFQLQIAEAQLKFADEGLKGKEGSEGAISARVLGQARNDQFSAFTTVEELKQRKPRLKSEIDAIRSRVDALSSQLSLLIDETLQVEHSSARRNAAAASLDEAQLAVEISELKVRRTNVLAPIPGRILRILVQPGSRVMGLEMTSAPSSSTVASMYDPNRLQVRVDVRLEDFTRVMPGQSVRIETASIREPILGTVLLPTSSANIQKNTIEVKVAIDEPPAGIRPEMLASASFISVASDSKDSSSRSEKLSLYVPPELVQSNDGVKFVWIVDTNSRAIRRSVVIGPIRPGNLVEVSDGLFPTDRLIASGYDSLRQNSKVDVRGEHETLGVNPSKPINE